MSSTQLGNVKLLPHPILNLGVRIQDGLGWAVLCLVAQSSPTLCDHIDYSPLGSSVHGILQAGTLEWVAISFSNT